MLVAMWRSRWRARPAAGATTVCPCPRAPRTLLLLMLRLILCPALFLSYSLHRFFSIITNLLPSFFILSYLFHTNKHTQQPLTQPGNFMCILCCGGEGRRTNDTTTTTARTQHTHTLLLSPRRHRTEHRPVHHEAQPAAFSLHRADSVEISRVGIATKHNSN